MSRQRSRHQRRPVLDLDGRILRRRALHRHEHDERTTCMSSACEVDVCGVVGMHALQLASRNAQRPARLEQQLRRRSRQGRLLPLQQPAQALLRGRPAWTSRRSSPAPSASENTYGTCVGQVKAGPMSFARFSTNDATGKIRGYVGEGEFTDDPLRTFGGAGVVEIPQPAGPAALHLRERLRASRRRQSVATVPARCYEATHDAISAGTSHALASQPRAAQDRPA